MWKALSQPAKIIIPLFIGLCCPWMASAKFMVRWLLVIMLLNACLGIKFSGLKMRLYHWYLLAANLVIGVLAWLIACWICGGNTEVAKAVFFTAISPMATAAPVVIAFLGGNVATVLMGFLISDIGISLFLIGLLPLVTGQLKWDFVNEVFLNIAFVMALPVFLSRVLLHFWPWLADFAKYKIAPHALWAWSIMLLILGGVARTTFDEQEVSAVSIMLQIGCATLAVCILNFLIGWLIGPRRCKLESSQLLGQKNTSFTIYLAITFASPVAALGPLFYILWHNSWNAIQMFQFEKRRQRKAARFLPSPAPADHAGAEHITS